MQVQPLGWKDPLVEGLATHPSILVWRIPWREEPGGLQSMGSQRAGHNWVNKQQVCDATWDRHQGVDICKLKTGKEVFHSSQTTKTSIFLNTAFLKWIVVWMGWIRNKIIWTLEWLCGVKEIGLNCCLCLPTEWVAWPVLWFIFFSNCTVFFRIHVHW